MIGGGQPQELDQPPKVAERRLPHNITNNSQFGDDYTINNQQQIRIHNKSQIDSPDNADESYRKYNNYSQDKEVTLKKAQEMENVLHYKQKVNDKQLLDNIDHDYNIIHSYKDHEEDDDSPELLSEALLAVASAEEYAAKITKLQQACLTPLKEDLADWLNKIMNMSTITKENFMDKLDNGVIICRMAKIISLWCYQQLQPLEDTIPQQQPINQNQYNIQAHFQQNYRQNNIQHIANRTKSRETGSLLSITTTDFHASSTTKGNEREAKSYGPFYNHKHHNDNKNSISSVIATPLRQPHARTSIKTNGGVPLRSSLQSINRCQTTSSTTNINGFGYNSNNHQLNRFLDNLIRMEQTKIWKDAKCRTFYARDNVSNFIRWSREFGVNQSVLFESDDLVLHANTRQVVLCLLDVARIACVKHGFTEAPGLVKFEQEIEHHYVQNWSDPLTSVIKDSNNSQSVTSSDNNATAQNSDTVKRKLSSLTKNTRKGSSSIADATDDLIMRYCIHKEEEAAKKKAAEAAAVAAAFAELEAAKTKLKEQKEIEEQTKLQQEQQRAKENLDSSFTTDTTIEASHHNSPKQPNNANETSCCDAIIDKQQTLIDLDSLITSTTGKDSSVLKSPSDDSTSAQSRHNLTFDNRVDSLDSGEGRTESASTSHSRTPVNHQTASTLTGISSSKNGTSSIPRPIKRSNSSSSLISNPTSSIGTSELSSSRSSLLSAQDSNSTTKRHIASDLDGKVMRIAKSYYGKAATKGVTRLSEGKYKIADRIVFVRLLKGHRVMVRIGGGWDTLENFLFRHKSDPSQVIDVDNLLPLETKMSFEKSPQLTPTHNKFSKLPYYRSSSASSTNISLSNLSVSTTSHVTSSKNNSSPFAKTTGTINVQKKIL